MSARLALVLALASPFAPLRAQSDPWFGADKVKHFFMAAFVQSVAYSTIRATGAEHRVALAGASVVTAGVSVGKEIWDGRGHGTRSGRDLLWDAAGAVAATELLRRTVR